MEVEEEAAAGLLIHTITLHFLGNSREDQAAAKSILINIRCPTLIDYRWYKDVFLTNVLKREDGLQQFWKERFIAGLPKLFGERILSKLRQNFSTNDIPFNLLSFGQLFGIVKSEGLNLCNEIKLQSKYESERAQSQKEMGNFCEAFGVTKIEAPSIVCKRINKKRAQPKRFSRPKPFVKKPPIESKPRPKGKPAKKQKKPIVCYKCGKTGHKSFQCKTEQKINELFSGEPELQKKLHSLLLQDKSEEEDDYYSELSIDFEYEFSPIPTLNVVTNKSQKEFLLDLIGQIPDGNMKREYLERLKTLMKKRINVLCLALILPHLLSQIFINTSYSKSLLTNYYKRFANRN